MSKGKDFKKTNPIVDMLVDSTLKRHGVKLEETKIDPKEKEQLKNMVDNLISNVEALTKENKEKEKDK